MADGMVVGELIIKYLADVKDIKAQLNSLDASTAKIKDAASKTADEVAAMGLSIKNVGTIFQSAIGAFASLGILNMANDMAQAAGRADEMQRTLYVVGKQAAYSKSELDAHEKSIRKMGISVIEARQSMTKMIQANMDMAKASSLARAAQDLAVISGLNSSETFQRMITNIQQMDTLGMRYMGILIDRTEAEKAYTRSINASGRELTKLEKQQAFLNATLKESEKLTGAYEASMDSWTKTARSTERFVQELKVALGDVMQGPLLTFERTMQQGMNALAKSDSVIKDSIGSFFGLAGIVGTVATAFRLLKVAVGGSPGQIAVVVAALAGIAVMYAGIKRLIEEIKGEEAVKAEKEADAERERIIKKLQKESADIKAQSTSEGEAFLLQRSGFKKKIEAADNFESLTEKQRYLKQIEEEYEKTFANLTEPEKKKKLKELLGDQTVIKDFESLMRAAKSASANAAAEVLRVAEGVDKIGKSLPISKFKEFHDQLIMALNDLDTLTDNPEKYFAMVAKIKEEQKQLTESVAANLVKEGTESLDSYLKVADEYNVSLQDRTQVMEKFYNHHIDKIKATVKNEEQANMEILALEKIKTQKKLELQEQSLQKQKELDKQAIDNAKNTWDSIQQIIKGKETKAGPASEGELYRAIDKFKGMSVYDVDSAKAKRDQLESVKAMAQSMPKLSEEAKNWLNSMKGGVEDLEKGDLKAQQEQLTPLTTEAQKLQDIVSKTKLNLFENGNPTEEVRALVNEILKLQGNAGIGIEASNTSKVPPIRLSSSDSYTNIPKDENKSSNFTINIDGKEITASPATTALAQDLADHIKKEIRSGQWA